MFRITQNKEDDQVLIVEFGHRSVGVARGEVGDKLGDFKTLSLTTLKDPDAVESLDNIDHEIIRMIFRDEAGLNVLIEELNLIKKELSK